MDIWTKHLRVLAKLEENIGKRVAFETSADRIDRLESENEKLKKGVSAVRDLINESFGIDGLHSNGDIASWDEFEEGGTLEEWLVDFNQAESI